MFVSLFETTYCTQCVSIEAVIYNRVVMLVSNRAMMLFKMSNVNRIYYSNLKAILNSEISHYRRFSSSYDNIVEDRNKYTAPTLTGLTDEQIIKVAEKNNYLRTKHLEIEGNLSCQDKDIVRRKRMIYRSKQRGWLEADILLGSWAVLHVPSLTQEELDQYEVILNEETIDVFNYVTGKLICPWWVVCDSVILY